MKKVLCFGDSNTYGFVPSTFGRYDKNTRWTGILANNFEVIEAGANNRTALESIKLLPEYIKTNPDIVILAIGINDTQFQHNLSETDIKNAIEKLVDMILPTRVILVTPSVLTENVLNSHIFSTMFDKTSIEKSKNLPEIYAEIAKTKFCQILDLNSIVEPSQIDGLHYEPEEHKIIAEKLAHLLLNP